MNEPNIDKVLEEEGWALYLYRGRNLKGYYVFHTPCEGHLNYLDRWNKCAWCAEPIPREINVIRCLLMMGQDWRPRK